MFDDSIKIEEINLGDFDVPTDCNYRLFVLRLDAINPVSGGNKLFKLKYNLLKANSLGLSKLLSFGGAYSNHIAALALAGKENGMQTIGIIRGDEYSSRSTTLLTAAKNGMHLHFVNRSDYRLKTTSAFIEGLRNKFGEFFLIPEGGSNHEGFQGCTEIPVVNQSFWSHILLAVGTGTTLAGIAAAASSQTRVTGIAVVNDITTCEQNVMGFLGEQQKPMWNINGDYLFGGYGKAHDDLLSFIRIFSQKTGIPSEPVYTGKMFYGVLDLMRKKLFESGSVILAIHTGGMQYFRHREVNSDYLSELMNFRK